MAAFVLSLFIVFTIFPFLLSRRVVKSSFHVESVASNSGEHLNATNIRGRRLDPVTSESHLVTNLPGLKDIHKIVHYAGHLTVDRRKGGNIFYWLIEAQTIDPLTGIMILIKSNYSMAIITLFHYPRLNCCKIADVIIPIKLYSSHQRLFLSG